MLTIAMQNSNFFQISEFTNQQFQQSERTEIGTLSLSMRLFESTSNPRNVTMVAIENDQGSSSSQDEKSERVRWKLPKRLKVLFLIGFCSIGGMLFYLHFWHNHEMGTGPAGPVVDRTLFSEPWSERKVLLLGLGDSITSGFGASPGNSYFNRTLKNPNKEFPDMERLSLSNVLPNLESLNRSLAGTTSIELIEFSLPKIETQPEETFGIVLITTGGNDVIHNYGRTPPREGAMYGATVAQAEPWFDKFEDRLNTILDLVEQKFPGGCEIFLGNIYDPTDGVGDTLNAGLPVWADGLEVLQRYNQIIETTCGQRKHVHLIDLHSTFLGHGIHCKKFWKETYRSDDPFYWYFDNLEDPNDRGYDAIRRAYLNKIARVIPQRL